VCTLRKPFDPVKSDIEMSKKLFFLITFSLSSTLFGHHNYRLQFDNSREVVMQGIVTNFEWKNPHLEIFFDVQNNKGEIENWILPTAAPRVAQNNGVHPDTLNIGDEITVSGWLARDGSNAMRARSMQLADGRSFQLTPTGRGGMRAGGGGMRSGMGMGSQN